MADIYKKVALTMDGPLLTTTIPPDKLITCLSKSQSLLLIHEVFKIVTTSLHLHWTARIIIGLIITIFFSGHSCSCIKVLPTTDLWKDNVDVSHHAPMNTLLQVWNIVLWVYQNGILAQ